MANCHDTCNNQHNKALSDSHSSVSDKTGLVFSATHFAEIFPHARFCLGCISMLKTVVLLHIFVETVMHALKHLEQN